MLKWVEVFEITNSNGRCCPDSDELDKKSRKGEGRVKQKTSMARSHLQAAIIASAYLPSTRTSTICLHRLPHPLHPCLSKLPTGLKQILKTCALFFWAGWGQAVSIGRLNSE